VVSLEEEVDFVGRRGECDVDPAWQGRRVAVGGSVGGRGLLLEVPVASSAEISEQLHDAWKRLSSGEVLALKRVELFGVLLEADRKLGPDQLC